MLLKKYKTGGKVKKGKKEEVPYYSTMRELALGVYKKQMEGKPLVGDEEKEYSKSGSYRAFQTTKPWGELGHLKVTRTGGKLERKVPRSEKETVSEFGRSAGASPLAKAKAHIKKKRKGGKKKKKTTDMPHGAMIRERGEVFSRKKKKKTTDMPHGMYKESMVVEEPFIYTKGKFKPLKSKYKKATVLKK